MFYIYIYILFLSLGVSLSGCVLYIFIRRFRDPGSGLAGVVSLGDLRFRVALGRPSGLDALATKTLD